MCVSLEPAVFQGTKGYAAEVQVGGKVLHVLGYQNTAKDARQTSYPSSEGPATWHKAFADVDQPGGNALLLHMPAVTGSMTPRNVLDTSSCSNFLKDMWEATRPRSRGAVSFGLLSADAAPVVFEHDIYTVVLANDANAIPGALSQVPMAKRPPLKPAIFNWYQERFPGWTFALCCFNNKDAQEAKPLLWWYEPMFPGFLHFPAVDAHDGNVPKFDGTVERDHDIYWGSYLNSKGGSSVHFTDEHDEKVRPYLLPRVFATGHHGSSSNGDFIVRVNDVRSGVPSLPVRIV